MMYEGIIVFQLIGLSLAIFLLIHSFKQYGIIRIIAIGFSIFIILTIITLMISTIVKAFKYKGIMNPSFHMHCHTNQQKPITNYSLPSQTTEARDVIILKVPTPQQNNNQTQSK